ncbi:hypothetical protein ABEH29_10335 [Pantoea agglomerans]|jgi:hypothetical protein|uniref:hypothetical protein n=1 Tax=Enterobacter agglomerans TaxID=549 RepID=UPI001654B2C7|nr:hypothetical protein [Pantoea agglomerans]SMQ21110.1 hypothetical protein SAMN02744765_0450 [Pantoea agglomerans]
MTQVTQLVITPPLMRQARNLQLAIIDLAKNRDLTPEQFRAHLKAIDMLAREAHDLIVDAEFEKQLSNYNAL